MRKKTNTEMIAFRLSRWEKEQLDKACKKTGQSRSRFIVMSILEKAERVKK